MSDAMCRIAAALLALGIFLFDVLLPLEGAVAVFYVLVVLIAARTSWRRDVHAASAAAFVLTLLAYFVQHGTDAGLGSPAFRALASVAAIAIATALVLQNQAATATLAAQARLLNLSHDMIFMRDVGGVIRFWNDAAEHVYGWPASEAIGRTADELLHTRYPEHRATVEASLLGSGRWEGILEQQTRSGTRLVLDSRWALQRNRHGQPVGVLETHTDITERQAAHAALVRSERRYRRMFDSSRIGVVDEDWSAVRAQLAALQASAAATSDHLAKDPAFVARARRLIRIVDVNPAFHSMVSGDPSRFPTTLDDILVATDRTLSGALAAFARGDTHYEGETEIESRDGRIIPVIFAITFPAPADDGDHVLVHILDITERRVAQDALHQAQVELAHAARVATLGELTASIAHEVSQPLMAIVTNGEAGMRWLRRNPLEPIEVEAAFERVVAEGRRASDIVKRIRAFLSKAPSHRAELAVATLVEDAAALVKRELDSASVQLRIDVPPDLPALLGDRIQLQQVLVNLMINAVHAMTSHPGQRVLCVAATRPAAGTIQVEVRDTGPGISPEHLQKLFAPFFSTKRDGMGMGLAICRTTAGAHGGHLSVESEPGRGAVFCLTLPARDADAVNERTIEVGP
jgi:PAS domain S-box-containing protein